MHYASGAFYKVRTHSQYDSSHAGASRLHARETEYEGAAEAPGPAACDK